MLRFEDDKTSIAEVSACWAKLADLRFLTQCIPNIESVVQSQPDQVRFKLRPGVSFVRGSLDVTFKIDQLEPGKSARYSIHSQGIGSSSDVEALLTLEPVENGSHLHWTVDVKSLGGLLKALPQGLIKASAQKVIGDIWSAVEKNLSDSKRLGGTP
jgi:carbon monoxide dehydrogenase subunit G